MSLAATLKESTARAHRRAESTDLQRGMAQGSLAEGHLVGYMAQLHRLHGDLERRMAAHPAVASLIGWTPEQEHSERLAQDLAELGTSVGAQPSLDATDALLGEIARLTDEGAIALIGLFYVLEGSMNGNRFIIHALRHTPAGQRCAFRYLDPYGTDQPAKWGAFRAALDSFEITADQRDLVIRSAHAMFDGIAAICVEVMSCDTVGSA